MNNENIVDWLEKIALTRGQRIIKSLVSEGKVEQAKATAERFVAKGAIKTTEQGSQLRALGGGSEGIATLIAGSKDAPLSARKLHNQRALYSEEQVTRKIDGGKMLRSDPRFAKLYSDTAHRTSANDPYMHYEYVHGGQGIGNHVRSHPEDAQRVIDAAAKLPRALPNRYLRDVKNNSGNVRVMPDGSLKVLDYLVAKHHEMAEMTAHLPASSVSKPSGEDLKEYYRRMQLGVGDQAEGSQTRHTRQLLSAFGPGSREVKKTRGAVSSAATDYVERLRARKEAGPG